ncbi:MAG: methylamine utilization protein [Gammaproteobacteria bacterium]
MILLKQFCQWLNKCSLNAVRLLLASFMLISSQVQAQSLRVELRDADGVPVTGAVVEVLLPEALAAEYRAPMEWAVDQVDKEFVPEVSAVVAGSEVRFPNSDAILHHVYSFSPAKVFNIPLYGQGDNVDFAQMFDNPGVIEIGCNIHDWMLAYIYVGQSRLMAITDENGVAIINDIPAGERSYAVWHARLDTPDNVLQNDIVIPDSGVAEVQLQQALQRDRRIRRAPSSSQERYR